MPTTVPNGDSHRISVVIPTVDRATLKNTLAALEKQTRPPDEIIPSYDTERRGISWARNRGISRATGDLIAFTDDDCEPPPEWLAVLVDILDRHHADGVGGTYREADPFLHEIRMRRRLPDREMVDDSGIVATGGNVMYTRAVIDDCLRRDGFVFNEMKPLAEDWELAWRIRRRGAKLVFAPLMVGHERRYHTLRDYCRFQFGRGAGIAPLWLMQKHAGDLTVQKSRLPDGRSSAVLAWASSFWHTCIGPFDVRSFSRLSYFMRFWVGSKAKALGFAHWMLFNKCAYERAIQR